MKKKIGFVPMDPVLGAWLLEMLAKHPPESDNAAELCAGVQDLLRGEVTSLLLSASGEGETPAPAESLQLGELEIFPKSRRVMLQGRDVSLTPQGVRHPMVSGAEPGRGVYQRTNLPGGVVG